MGVSRDVADWSDEINGDWPLDFSIEYWEEWQELLGLGDFGWNTEF
jgi:hypothetical protein